MKRIFALACLLLAFLCACQMKYREDLSPYELADYLEEEGVASSLRQMDDNVGFFGDLSVGAPFSLRLAEDGSNLDEFAVFSCEDEKAAKSLAKKLESYLNERYEKDKDWYLSYIPEELPKLQGAEVKTYGKYVVYAILAKDAKNRTFDLLQQKLLQVK